ncbi:hypothetical protein NQ318_019010 [Aromia moschata]|uniref:Uncharacterized protein n=1 Tax=Aromia moschata TaxID=1265417 RepID=A0AAV8YEG8_9CUCU|nr:hypothetical protein NQ318_019010 [Aromia moschata]
MEQSTNRTVGTENPHCMMEANIQYPEKVNVWAGIINSQIIGPYFFDGTLTGARYLDFLQNVLVPELENLDLTRVLIMENVWELCYLNFGLARLKLTGHLD